MAKDSGRSKFWVRTTDSTGEQSWENIVGSSVSNGTVMVMA